MQKTLAKPSFLFYRAPNPFRDASLGRFVRRNDIEFGVPTMAVPKRKTSPMKRGFRRSHDAIANPTYVEDKDSGELRRPHHVDLKSGMYRGRQILAAKK